MRVGHLDLQVEGQLVDRAPGDQVQMAAHRPEEIVGRDEGRRYSSAVKTPSSTRSSRVLTPWMYLAIQNSVCRSRNPPLPSFTLGSTT